MLFDLLTSILLITIAIALPLISARVATGNRSVKLRRLPAIEAIDTAIARAAETGKPLHLSPGAGPLHGTNVAPETLAGLMLAQRVATVATRRGATVMASSGDAVAHLILRGEIHSAYRDAGYIDDYQPDSIELYADHSPLAFAVGQGQRFATQTMEASIDVGPFGESFLLLGEQARQAGVDQIAGTTNPTSLAAAVITANDVLYGEEIYVAEAYVSSTSVGIARIISHDFIRYLVLFILVLGVGLVLLRDFGILDTSFPLLRGL